MTDKERIEIVERQIDKFLSIDSKDGCLNFHNLQCALICRQILKDGAVSMHSTVKELTDEPWRKGNQ